MINSSKAWHALMQHKMNLNTVYLKELFEANPNRFTQFSLQFENILFDFSKNLLTEDTLTLLEALSEEAKIPEKRAAMFAGQLINRSENRASLHAVLRMPADKTLQVGGQDLVAAVQKTLGQMEAIVDKIHAKKWLGYSGKAITDIVNIGVGGSDLGPRMAFTALKAHSLEIVRCHFVSNIDGSHLAETVKFLNPENTLFIISSKSFTTIETLSNAAQAKRWLANGKSTDVSNHFIAITNKKQRALDFGVKHILEIHDWVGGRYSLWSAIGLPIMLSIGAKQFKRLLAGAHAMDEHFRTAPFKKNIPLLLGMIGAWYHNFFNAATYAVLPYNQYLTHLIPHLQQLDMESNGKRVTQEGEAIPYQTGPIIWGGIGSDSQHAFHQLLHQGTSFTPVDFIVCAKSQTSLGYQHKLLYCDCLSQSQAFMLGKTLEEAELECLEQGLSADAARNLAPHKVMPGNRPSNTLVLEHLSPYTLGLLIALYEHKVFVQGALWDINSFDQWGVELGKTLAKNLVPIIQKDKPLENLDSSTQGLIRYFLEVCP